MGQSKEFTSKRCLVPVDISCVTELNRWLSLFVVEARRSDGLPYPPATLYGLVSGVMRYLREHCHRIDCDILSKTDKSFIDVRNTLDAQMKSLTRLSWYRSKICFAFQPRRRSNYLGQSFPL